MQNYTSKTLFIGIDVHKKTYVLACICEGELIKRSSPKSAVNSGLQTGLC